MAPPFMQTSSVQITSPRMLSDNNEKQISVDPISLKQSNLSPPLPLPPTHKFLSYSLPNSATSSPKFPRKSRNQNNPMVRQHSVALANLERLKQSHLRRSKSCGEGRASVPPEEFDMWFARTNVKQVAGKTTGPETETQGSFRVGGESIHVNFDERNPFETSKATRDDDEGERFKCGALCLFIPGFGKTAKPVISQKEEMASLERFECGSWTTEANSTRFFDLPMELIRCKSVNDMHSPVSTAFVFDQKSPKGVLKNSCGGSARKSVESSRHVRFSTSSPTSYPASPTSCITPRLRKAREDFNAFLEAQSA